MGSIKGGMMVKMDSPLLGEPKSFNINDRQGFVLSTDMSGTTKKLQGVARCTKKLH